MKLSRLLTALAATAFVLAGCSGGSSDTANSNYVDVDFGENDTVVVATADGQAAAVTVATEPLAATAVDETTLGDLTAIYDSFLTLRANAVISEAEVSDLADVATPAAMDQVTGLRADSDAAHAAEKYSALTGLYEWSNVTTIHERGDEFIFTDCTERQELNSIGSPQLRFVTNEIVMVPDNGTYKVDRVTELQSGFFAEFVGDYGCVPPSFTERAETIAAQAITQVATMTADPAQAVADGVPDIFVDEAAEELAYIVDLLNEQNLSRTADETVEISVVGMDTNKPDFTVIVSVCRRYPNGRSYTDSTTGEATVSDLARGSSEQELLFVQIEAVPAGSAATDVVTRVESTSSSC